MTNEMPMKRHALFVGVNNYADSTIQNLNYPSDDATELASVFRHLLKFDRVEKLINPKHSPEVVDAVKDMTRGLGPGDLFLFFFAGHGFRVKENHVLVCARDEFADLEDEYAGLPVGQLKKRMRGPWNRMLVLDACQNDIRATRGADTGVTGRDLALIHETEEPTSDSGCQIVLTACSEGQKALEVSDLGHGLFTSAFLGSVTSFADARRRLDLEALRADLGKRMGGLIAQYRLSGRQEPLFTMPTDASGIVLLDGAAATTMPSNNSPVMVECPICGKYNRIDETFKCKVCGKDHLCLEHFSTEHNCCYACSESIQENLRRAKEFFNKGEQCSHGVGGMRKSYARAVDFYRKAAELGHADAQSHLGDCYYEGVGIHRDYEGAITWFQKAAELGNAHAQYMLGVMYGGGKGVKRDYDESARWYKMASGNGDVHALQMLGLCYAQGRGVARDYIVAYKCLRKAFDAGEKGVRDQLKKLEAIAEVQYAIGAMYAKGEVVKKDPKQAVLWFRRAVRNGYLEAKMALGLAILDGESDDKNIAEAEKSLRNAASAGNLDARKALGDVYRRYGEKAKREGRDAKEWYEKALRMYLDSVRNHDQSAQYALAHLYWELGDHKEAGHWCNLLLSQLGEDGIKPETQWLLGELATGAERVKWFQKAAENGNSAAQGRLGDLYCTGEHPDFEKAFTCFLKAAEKGDLDAEYRVGRCYKNGIGVVRNVTEAINWFQKAAGRGHVEARAVLGEMLFKGDGCDKNVEAAIKWLRKAAIDGNCHAQEILGDHYLEIKYESEALKWYRKAIKQYLDMDTRDNVELQKRLGRLYALTGDVQESAKWSGMVVARCGENAVDPLAQYALGCQASGVEKVKWWRLAAGAGNIDAQYELGCAYYDGKYGVERDKSEAVKSLFMAMKEGHIQAREQMFKILIFDDGFGCTVDMFEWFLDLSKKQCGLDIMLRDLQRKICCYAIGLIYAHGLGVERNAANAENWFRTALAVKEMSYGPYEWRLDWRLDFELAELYYNGIDGKRDIRNALNLYDNAFNLYCNLQLPYSQNSMKWLRKFCNIYYCGDESYRDTRKAIQWFKALVCQRKFDGSALRGWVSVLGIVGAGDVLPVLEYAAQNGDVEAQCQLGWLHMNGFSIPKSEEGAVQSYRKATERSFADGQYYLGWAYLLGKGVRQNVETGMSLIFQALQQGDEKAASVYAHMKDLVGNNSFDLSLVDGIASRECEMGHGAYRSEKYDQAFCHYLISAEIGCADACYVLYQMYRDGTGVRRDIFNIVNASMWLHKAGLQGSVDAQKTLARLYGSGDGIICKDETKAKDLLVCMSNRGDMSAQLTLAEYYYGRGAYDEAFRLYDGVATQGSDVARQIILERAGEASRMVSGRIAHQVILKWLCDAAEGGDIAMQLKLGGIYLRGPEDIRNETEAFKWYDAAASRGDSSAQKAIFNEGWAKARLFVFGQVNAKSPVAQEIILKWTTILAEAGNVDAMDHLAAYHHATDIRLSFKWCSRSIRLRCGSEYYNTSMDWLLNFEDWLPTVERWEFDEAGGVVASRCKKLADEGDPHAQFRLSRCFEKGIGVRQNYKKAIFWCKAAVEHGDTGAKGRLAFLQKCLDKSSFWGRLFS